MKKLKVIEQLKEDVYRANISLPQLGLVKLTWGNVSVIDRDLGVIVIKPSGVNYKTMTVKDMVVTDLNGKILEENALNPSSDLCTHVELYRQFSEINSIVHTHSLNAVSWAQTGKDLPVYGTTHADAFYGNVPNTRYLSEKEVSEAYECNTGKLIIETFQERNLDPIEVPGILVNGHGPFTWGRTIKNAVENSLILEEICTMAIKTQTVNNDTESLPSHIIEKHYQRKHGKKSYYGQSTKKEEFEK